MAEAKAQEEGERKRREQRKATGENKRKHVAPCPWRVVMQKGAVKKRKFLRQTSLFLLSRKREREGMTEHKTERETGTDRLFCAHKNVHFLCPALPGRVERNSCQTKKKKQMGGMPTATHSLRVCDTHKVTHVTLFLSLFCHRLSDIHKHGGRRKELLCVRTANERSLPAYQRKRSEGRTWGVLPRCVHRLQNEDRCVSTVFIRESTGAPQKRGCKKKLGGQKDSRQVRSINR